MTKDFTAETLYSWKRCIPEEERPDWELLTFNPDDFFGTCLLLRHKGDFSYAIGVVGEASNSDCFFRLPDFLQFYFKYLTKLFRRKRCGKYCPVT